MRRIAGVIAAGAMVAASLVSVTSASAAVDGCANPAAVRVATGAELEQALSARVNGKVICITADLTLPTRGAASWTDFSLTIDGGGHTLTVDPQGAGLLFDLSGPDAATITLANMEFVGDVMRNNNSIFHVQGDTNNRDNLLISNVTFQGIRNFGSRPGVMGSGPAIYAVRLARVDLDGVYVSDTLAQSYAPVDISARHIRVNASSFHRNRAVHDVLDLTSRSTCARTAGGNMTGPRAGGASLMGGLSITVTASIFWNNAAECGGALHVSDQITREAVDGQASITGSSIAYNEAYVLDGGGIVAERLDTLTVSDSGVLANKAKRAGGGIDTSDVDTLTVSRSGVNFNATETGDGGGINASSENAGSKVVIDTSIVRNNTAGFSGGGVAAEMGTVSLLASRVSGNTALEGDGGGVYALEPDGAAAADYRIRLDGSTFSANTAAEGEGGGVRAITTSPTQVVNSTIVENRAKLAGGLDVPVGPLEMQFVTVTGNRATSEQGAGIALGRGLAAGADIASTVVNSITWGNTGAGAADLWVSAGAANRASVNYVIHTSAGSVNVPVSAGDIVADPQLAPLGNNGGPAPDASNPMLTRAPLAGSPALRAGTATSVAVDQVGAARTVATPTIGAVERAVARASAPLNLVATAGDRAVLLTWSPPRSDGGSPVTGYVVEQSRDGGRNWEASRDADPRELAALVAGLTNGTEYSFRVTAITDAGAGAPTAAVTATPRASLPLAPGRPTGTPGDNAIALQWAPPANADVARITGYRIDRSSDGGTNWSTISANTGSRVVRATDRGVANGSPYVYRVAAINESGVGPFSDPSAAIVPSADLPSAPGRPVAEPGDGRAALVWAPPADEGDRPITGYRIEWTTDGVTWTEAVADTGSTQTTATVDGLANGTTYAFRVSAISAAGQGASSAPSAGVVPQSPVDLPVNPDPDPVPGPQPDPVPGPQPDPGPAPPVPPAPGPEPGPDVQPQPALPGAFASIPREVTATARNASAVVRWTEPTTSGTYAVTRYWVSANPGGAGCLAEAPSRTCTVKGLVNGTTYTFTVEALTAAGWSAPSEPSNAVTPPGEGTIEISGKRTTVRGKKGLVVTGTSTGLDAGTILRPWVKFPGQSDYFQGVARIKVRDDGTFTWQRKGNKKTYVYVATEDGSIRSDRIIIEPAPRGR